jgi:tetratricopeptide (TPR) repeat protein
MEKSNPEISKTTKRVLFATGVIVVSMILTSFFLFKTKKISEDPRIAGVDLKFNNYDKLLEKQEYVQSIELLRSIDSIYSKYTDYQNSFEMAILQNSKAVNWLQYALSEKNDSIKHSYLDSAKSSALTSIRIFKLWINEYEHLSRNQIIIKIKPYYLPDDPLYREKNLVKIINKRAEKILKAQKETSRQLSIAYTNLGSVNQYLGDFKAAIDSNRRAIEIWGKNETAKKNISNLVDRTFN